MFVLNIGSGQRRKSNWGQNDCQCKDTPSDSSPYTHTLLAGVAQLWCGSKEYLIFLPVNYPSYRGVWA